MSNDGSTPVAPARLAPRKLRTPNGQAEGATGDQAAENVPRKTLTALEEARAVAKMPADGYTVDGAATVLGWPKRRVTARRRILELPETAQTPVGSGEIRSAGSTRCWTSRPSPPGWRRWWPR